MLSSVDCIYSNTLNKDFLHKSSELSCKFNIDEVQGRLFQMVTSMIKEFNHPVNQTSLFIREQSQIVQAVVVILNSAFITALQEALELLS
jgi:hypothetical protein